MCATGYLNNLTVDESENYFWVSRCVAGLDRYATAEWCMSAFGGKADMAIETQISAFAVAVRGKVSF
jgi:hypothetical protein